MNQIASEVLSGLPVLRTSLPGPKARQVIQRDRKILSPSYTRSYPLVAERGEGAMVEDVDGNRFLDCNAGIAVVATGHCHPAVVKSIQEQAAKLVHMSGTDFYYENMVTLAERLAAIAPGDAERRVYYGNSGALGALSLTASKSVQRKGFAPLVPGVTHIPYAYCYRCPYNRQPETCNAECARVIEDQLLRTALPAEEVAAIVVEPVQGEGGYVVPPKKFFDELQRIARKFGMLLVCDEVQSGMGRTGKMWASEHFGLEPDIITVAKGIASGMPLGATVARAELMQWKPGAHASTFGGNPVSVAAALATIELLENELIENAARVGAHFMNRMKDWPRRFAHVGEVRGLGLMIGVEIVRDQQSREAAPELRDRLVQMAFERGVLLLGAGASVIRLSPPLVMTTGQADFVVDTLEECLKTAAA